MADPAYSVEGLEHGIEQADRHIAQLKSAIADQRALKKRYRQMIQDLKAAKRGPVINVEVEHGSQE